MADYADESAQCSRARSDIDFAGCVVKVDPAAVLVFYDALCAYDEAVLFCVVQCEQHLFKFVLCVAARRLAADGFEYLIRIVFTVVMMVMVVVVFMVVAVMLVLVVIVIVFVVVMMVMMLVFVVIVVIIVFIVMMMVVMVFMFVVIFIMIVVMVVVTLALGVVALLFLFFEVFLDHVMKSL